MPKNLTIPIAALFALNISILHAQTWNIGSPTEANITAALSSGTLTIRGTGNMQSWFFSSDVPWYSVHDSIHTVVINNGVASIGKNAFYSCGTLTSVTIPNSVISIEKSAFESCDALTSVTIPSSAVSIGDWTFAECRSLTSVIIPNLVTSIGNGAFAHCRGLTAVSIPNSVTSIGNGAFAHCSGLTAVTIPYSVTSIGNSAFHGCSGLTSVTIPHSVASIGYWTFGKCGALTSVTIPNSVASIGDNAFAYCSSLTAVTIPHSVTTIGNGAFAHCSGLTSIYVKAIIPPQIESSVFDNVSKYIPLHVPCGKKSDYQTVTYWNDFTNIIEDVALEDLNIQSADITMGVVSIAQHNTCTNNQAEITATANAGYRFVQWTDGDTVNPRIITVTQDAAFTAEFEAETGIAEIKSASSLRIYHNPVSDYLTIESGLYIIYGADIADTAGKTILKVSPIINNSVNISNLPSGVYFVKIETDKGVVVKKIVKD